MDIKIYTGGHRKSFEHLYGALVENRAYLEAEGVVFLPATRRTNRRISNAIKLVKSGDDVIETQNHLLETLGCSQKTKTFIILDSNLIGTNNRSFSRTFFHTRVGGFFKDLKALFPEHNVRIYTETRSPETLIKSAYTETVLSGAFHSFEDYLDEHKMNEFRWSKYIHRIQGKDSIHPLTAWRYEDYPYIWRDVIGAFTGISNSQDLVDGPEPIATGISFQGAQLFSKYIKEYPDTDDESKKKVRETFLRQFPNTTDETENVYWSLTQAEAFQDSYNDDWYYIERMSNIEIIRSRNF